MDALTDNHCALLLLLAWLLDWLVGWLGFVVSRSVKKTSVDGFLRENSNFKKTYIYTVFLLLLLLGGGLV